MPLILSEDGELQVQSYLRFAKLKRDQHVREFMATISDFKSEHIRQGEMYSYKELSQIFRELEQETKLLIDKEIQNAYHTNALLVKILLSQAQAQGADLAVDTNALENELLLKQISSSEATALARPASDFLRRNSQLSRLGAVATIATQDPALVKECDGLKAELAAAQERMIKLQEDTTKMMRDRTALNNQINSLKDELAAKDKALMAARGDKDASVSQLQNKMEQLSASAANRSHLTAAEVDQLKKQAGGLGNKVAALMDELQVEKRGGVRAGECPAHSGASKNQLALKDKELRAAGEALNGKLQESKQFLQMKQMMQAKSQEVAALRKRLEKHEPQNVPSADTF